MRNRHRLAFCAVLAALSAGATEIQLLPAGDFRGIDGRPAEVPSWRVDAQVAARLQAKFDARANPLPIDYEHQTLRAAENGQPAPAAGWLKSLEWRDGQGLFGVVEWTDRARSMIAAGEYRYISPVFSYDVASGEPQELMPPALVNYPAIDGMQAVALSALAESWSGSISNEEITMNELLKAVLKALGLPEDVKVEAATSAIAALKAKADAGEAATGEVTELKAKAAKVGELETQIAALKAAGPDPAKYVPVESLKELQTQVATLSAANRKREIDDLVAPALADGRLLASMEPWARSLGEKSVADLKGYLDSAKPIAALVATQTGGKPPEALVNGKDANAIAAAASELMAKEAAAGRSISSAEAVKRVCAPA